MQRERYVVLDELISDIMWGDMLCSDCIMWLVRYLLYELSAMKRYVESIKMLCYVLSIACIAWYEWHEL